MALINERFQVGVALLLLPFGSWEWHCIFRLLALIFVGIIQGLLGV